MECTEKATIPAITTADFFTSFPRNINYLPRSSKKVQNKNHGSIQRKHVTFNYGERAMQNLRNERKWSPIPRELWSKQWKLDKEHIATNILLQNSTIGKLKTVKWKPILVYTDTLWYELRAVEKLTPCPNGFATEHS